MFQRVRGLPLDWLVPGGVLKGGSQRTSNSQVPDVAAMMAGLWEDSDVALGPSAASQIFNWLPNMQARRRAAQRKAAQHTLQRQQPLAKSLSGHSTHSMPHCRPKVPAPHMPSGATSSAGDRLPPLLPHLPPADPQVVAQRMRAASGSIAHMVQAAARQLGAVAHVMTGSNAADLGSAGGGQDPELGKPALANTTVAPFVSNATGISSSTGGHGSGPFTTSLSIVSSAIGSAIHDLPQLHRDNTHSSLAFSGCAADWSAGQLDGSCLANVVVPGGKPGAAGGAAGGGAGGGSSGANVGPLFFSGRSDSDLSGVELVPELDGSTTVNVGDSTCHLMLPAHQAGG